MQQPNDALKAYLDDFHPFTLDIVEVLVTK